MLKYFKEMHKTISIATKSKGRRGPWYGGISIWIITWYAEDFIDLCLGMGVGCFHFCPPADGALEMTRSATEGLTCASMLELTKLGAIGSAEDTPSPSALSPASTFGSAAKAPDWGKAPEDSQAKQVY
jgi:hypothetical protein